VPPCSLQDACPFLTTITSLTIAQCRGIAGGAFSLGLHSALQAFVARGARLLQARQDQLDAVALADPTLPIVTHTSFGYNTSEVLTSQDYLELRELGSKGLFPAYDYVVG
jgi:hypothetical protein